MTVQTGTQSWTAITMMVVVEVATIMVVAAGDGGDVVVEVATIMVVAAGDGGGGGGGGSNDHGGGCW